MSNGRLLRVGCERLGTSAIGHERTLRWATVCVLLLATSIQGKHSLLFATTVNCKA
jgi:hypothetical protein